jgi:hypothetical protein
VTERRIEGDERVGERIAEIHGAQNSAVRTGHVRVTDETVLVTSERRRTSVGHCTYMIRPWICIITLKEHTGAALLVFIQLLLE